MNTLGWMHRKFRQNNYEESRNVSTRKSYSCFSAPWELDEQQYYPETKNNSANSKQPRVCSESSFAHEVHSVEEAKEGETFDMIHEFFHGFLAIGTLGSISITNEPTRPKVAMPFKSATEEETGAADNKLQSLNKMLETLIENDVHDISNESSKGRVTSFNEKDIKGMDSKENKNMVVYPVKEYSEMSATKEEAKEQKVTHDNLLKKTVTSYKRSGKIDKGDKREDYGLHFMKKVLKKFDFISRCSPTSASRKPMSTEKKPSKVFRKSRKIYPEAADLHITMSHKYEVNNMSYDEGYDKEVKLEDADDMYHHDGVIKKEIVSSMFASRSLNSQPTGKKAHWIKTDADYLVLEF